MKKILKISLIVILIIALVVGGYFIALNMTKKQAMDTVDKMFTALKTGDEEQIKQYINIKDVIEENATSEDNIADNQDMEKAMLKNLNYEVVSKEQLKQYFIEQYNSEDIETVTTEVTINMKKEDGKWNIDCDEDAFVDAVLPGYREVEEALNNMNKE